MNDSLLFDMYEHYLHEVIKSHIDYKSMINELTMQICYQRFCYGGNMPHRGYYCPSIIQDIVVGNSKRGRLSNKRTGNPSFSYSFDYHGNMILVQDDFNTELIIQNRQTELGISITNDDFLINSLSICQYDSAKLSSYVLLLNNISNNTAYEIYEERYNYSEKGLVVTWSRSLRIDKKHYLNAGEVYSFSVDSGFLSSYTVRSLDNENVSENDNRVFKVTIKRKIT